MQVTSAFNHSEMRMTIYTQTCKCYQAFKTDSSSINRNTDLGIHCPHPDLREHGPTTLAHAFSMQAAPRCSCRWGSDICCFCCISAHAFHSTQAVGFAHPPSLACSCCWSGKTERAWNGMQQASACRTGVLSSVGQSTRGTQIDN